MGCNVGIGAGMDVGVSVGVGVETSVETGAGVGVLIERLGDDSGVGGINGLGEGADGVVPEACFNKASADTAVFSFS